MRVLIIEDEPKMADLLRRGLADRGAVVDVAGRGEDAPWMAAATSFGAIVLDVMLPGIDGFETCRRLREARVWSPVLMLTPAARSRTAWPASAAAPTTAW